MTRMLLLQQRGDHRDHVHVAAQMIGLHERAVGLLGDVAQVGEEDLAGEALGHGRNIVAGPAPSEPVQNVMPLAPES